MVIWKPSRNYIPGTLTVSAITGSSPVVIGSGTDCAVELTVSGTVSASCAVSSSGFFTEGVTVSSSFIGVGTSMPSYDQDQLADFLILLSRLLEQQKILFFN